MLAGDFYFDRYTNESDQNTNTVYPNPIAAICPNIQLYMELKVLTHPPKWILLQ